MKGSSVQTEIKPLLPQPTNAQRQLQRKYYIMRGNFLQALLENDDERMEPMTNEERKMFKTFINMREEIAMNRLKNNLQYLEVCEQQDEN